MFLNSWLRFPPPFLSTIREEYHSKGLVLARKVFIDFLVEYPVKYVLALSYGVR